MAVKVLAFEPSTHPSGMGCPANMIDRFEGQPEMLKEAQDKTAELNVAYEAIMKRRGL